MIFKPRWQSQIMKGEYVQLLAVSHGDMTRMVGWLRDAAVDIWTESPTDSTKLTPGRQHYSLEGWRIAWKARHASVNGVLQSYGAEILGFEPGLKTAGDGLVASLVSISQVFNAVIANYEDANGDLIQTLVSPADRNALADAMAAELEP